MQSIFIFVVDQRGGGVMETNCFVCRICHCSDEMKERCTCGKGCSHKRVVALIGFAAATSLITAFGDVSSLNEYLLLH